MSIKILEYIRTKKKYSIKNREASIENGKILSLSQICLSNNAHKLNYLPNIFN